MKATRDLWGTRTTKGCPEVPSSFQIMALYGHVRFILAVAALRVGEILTSKLLLQEAVSSARGHNSHYGLWGSNASSPVSEGLFFSSSLCAAVPPPAPLFSLVRGYFFSSCRSHFLFLVDGSGAV